MVRVAETLRNTQDRPRTTYVYAPQVGANIIIRQTVALAVIVLLYTAAIPFTPAAWLCSVDGGFLLDRLFSGFILLGSAYFQCRIASLRFPLVISTFGTNGTAIRNGRIYQGGNVLFIWNPANYWPCVTFEVLLLCFAEWGGGGELVRRSIVSGVVIVLWLVGLPATPESTKLWAWDLMKRMWFWIVLDEVLSIGRGYGRPRRRRW